jgi:hypothetical protein
MAKNQKNRKVVTVTEETFSSGDFEGTLKSLLEKTQELIRKYGENARLDYDKYFSYPYDNDYYPSYMVQVSRPETDEEMNKRVAEEKSQQDKVRQRELAELERLSKKYNAEKQGE